MQIDGYLQSDGCNCMVRFVVLVFDYIYYVWSSNGVRYLGFQHTLIQFVCVWYKSVAIWNGGRIKLINSRERNEHQ